MFASAVFIGGVGLAGPAVAQTQREVDFPRAVVHQGYPQYTAYNLCPRGCPGISEGVDHEPLKDLRASSHRLAPRGQGA